MRCFKVACGLVLTIMACAESPSPPPGELVGVYAKTRERTQNTEVDLAPPLPMPYYLQVWAGAPDGDAISIRTCDYGNGACGRAGATTLSWADGAYRMETRSAQPQYQEVPPGAYIDCEFTYRAAELTVVGAEPTRIRLTECVQPCHVGGVSVADCTRAGTPFPTDCPTECTRPAITEADRI